MSRHGEHRADLFAEKVATGQVGGAGIASGISIGLEDPATVTIATINVFAALSDPFEDDPFGGQRSGFSFVAATGVINVESPGTRLYRVRSRFVGRASDNSNVSMSIGIGINGALPAFPLISATRATTDLNGTWFEIDALVNLTDKDVLQLHARNATNTVNLVMLGVDPIQGAGNVAPIPHQGFFAIGAS